jgi:hypothetical protein
MSDGIGEHDSWCNYTVMGHPGETCEQWRKMIGTESLHLATVTYEVTIRVRQQKLVYGGKWAPSRIAQDVQEAVAQQGKIIAWHTLDVVFTDD